MSSLRPLSAIFALSAVIVASVSANAQAREVVVTDADDGNGVTLGRGDTLIVRLKSNHTTAYSWYTVLSPTSVVELARHRYIPDPCPPGRVGCGGVDEFRFVPAVDMAPVTFERGEWLRMLSLTPFDPGVEGARLWQVDVTLAP